MKHLRWFWWVILAVVVVVLPWFLHSIRPEKPLDLVIVDKTVPYKNYIEHRSLFWLLDHFNFVRSEGEGYRVDEHYIGTTPGPEPGDAPGVTRDLVAADVRHAELIYLVDTYGVYRDDLESGGEMRAALERSPKLYGGLTDAEAMVVRRAALDGKTIVAEFNTFASPTGAQPRAVMESMLGLHWTQWIGRYFIELADEREVPRWVVRNYEREWRETWDFEGPGYVLLRDDAHVEVLRPAIETLRIGLTIERNEPVDPILSDAYDRIPYFYWFDVVEATPEAEVLAWFEWHLRPEGELRIGDRGLPKRFPAVLRNIRERTATRKASTSYYFAGDFADNPLVKRRVPLAGYLRMRSWIESGRIAPSEEAFFWRFYAPMMGRLLDQHASGGL